MNSGYKNDNKKKNILVSKLFFNLLIAQLFSALVADTLGKIGIGVQVTAVLFIFTTILGVMFKVNYRDSFLPPVKRTDYRIIWYLLWFAIMGAAYYIDPLANTMNFMGIVLPTRFIFIATLSLMILFMLQFTDVEYKNYTSAVMPILVLIVVVNIILMMRAVSVYGDAVRAPRITEAMGYGEYLFGLPGYSILYACSLLSPIAFMYIFITKGDIYRKWAWIFAGILTVSIFMSQLATAAIGMVVGFILLCVLKSKSKFRWLMILVLAAVAIILVLSDAVSEILLFLSRLVPEDVSWHEKLISMAQGFMTEDGSVVQGRDELYMISFETFLESPLVGAIFTNTAYSYGGHSTFLDMLATVGILGTTPFILFMISCYKHAIRPLKTREAVSTVQTSYFIFLLFFFMKNMISSYAIFIALFILVPILAQRVDDYASHKYAEEKGIIFS
jgi:hypothetical protein